MNPTDREERRQKRSMEKKEKKSRKRHYHHSSSSPHISSSCEHKKGKKKNRKQVLSSSSTSSSLSLSDTDYDHQKRRKRRQHSRSSERGRKHLQIEKSRKIYQSSKRADQSCFPVEVASCIEDAYSSASPEEIVCTMLQKFPTLANDLEQLLKSIEDGQAVDLSGLSNKHIAAYLQQLFKALSLHKTDRGLFYLPDRASKKTLQALGPFLRSTAQAFAQDPKEVDVLKQTVESKSNKDGLESFEQRGPSEQRRRVLGPAMPSAQELETAARLTKIGPLPRDTDEESAMNSIIGPPPAAAFKELESANEAERYEEVERLLAPDIGNAYELLGLRVGATAESLKKRYWKLSLLVHPDKCSHPQAHQAFMALNQAFKDLQDPTKRSLIEQKIEEKETREEFEAEMKAKRESAQWRKLRGELLPGDEALLDTSNVLKRAVCPSNVLKRDVWMTELPPERKAGAYPQRNTFFSRHGRSGRGDTSVWTDNPLEEAQKAKTAFLEWQRHAALTGGCRGFLP